MDNTDILEQIANNPDILAELTRDERFKDTINAAANDSVIKSRDKALREKNNWKEKYEVEASIAKETKDEPMSEPVVAQPKIRSDSSPELLQRLKEVEEQLAYEKRSKLDSQKQIALSDALGSLPLRDGGLGVASKLIGVDSFDVQSDGSIRHNQTGMNLSEYVTDEWSKTKEAQLVLDTSANRGAGASQGRRSNNSSLGKKFSESSFDEKNKYFLENDKHAYEEWKARG